MRRSQVNGLQKADRSESGNLAGILGNIETHTHVTLCSQVVTFIGLDRSDDVVQRTRVVEVAIHQIESSMRNLRVFINGIDPSVLSELDRRIMPYTS